MNINFPPFLRFSGKNYASNKRVFMKQVATMLIYLDRIELAEEEPNKHNILRVTDMATCAFGVGYVTCLFRNVTSDEFSWSNYVMEEACRFCTK